MCAEGATTQPLSWHCIGVHSAKAWVMEGVCGANACVAQWLVCSTALPCCMVLLSNCCSGCFPGSMWYGVSRLGP